MNTSLDDVLPGQDEGDGVDKKLKKQLRIAKEKKELLESLAASNFSGLKTRVAFVLNLFPSARNSDISLALKFWETFQSDIYRSDGILPRDLFKLERLHYIVRARAKIQNEYGLFLADTEIRRNRRKNEETIKAEVLADVPERKIVKVYADETGKNHKYVIVAAVWLLSGRAEFTVSQAIKKWQELSFWKSREVHFARLSKQDIEPLREYLDVVVGAREYLSFKVVAVEKSKTKRSIEEVVKKLHEYMLMKGAQHEVDTGRVSLPRSLIVTIDEEQSLDSFVLSEIKDAAESYYERNFGNASLMVESIKAVPSKGSALVQLSDMVAGAVNRKLNHDGERGHKCEMADMIIESLGLTLQSGEVEGLDASAMFHV